MAKVSCLLPFALSAALSAQGTASILLGEGCNGFLPGPPTLQVTFQPYPWHSFQFIWTSAGQPCTFAILMQVYGEPTYGITFPLRLTPWPACPIWVDPSACFGMQSGTTGILNVFYPGDPTTLPVMAVQGMAFGEGGIALTDASMVWWW